MCAFVGEEYIKSLIDNPDLVDRLACVSDEGVCLYSLLPYLFYKIILQSVIGCHMSGY